VQTDALKVKVAVDRVFELEIIGQAGVSRKTAKEGYT
jgi:hypothetical protein